MNGIIILYAVATVVAIIARRLRVPYTAALLVTGVVLGSLHVVELPHLTKELLFAIFLPGLLFEAAYHLEVKELRDNAMAIVALAVPGVALSIVLTASLLIAGTAFLAGAQVAWSTALLFGAVVAATDPVAVTALFREVSAPRRLHVLVESESLLNDGTAIVFLSLLVSYYTGGSRSSLYLLVDFMRIAGGGLLIGWALGWWISHIRTRLDDAAIEITLTTIAAYGSFVIAEQLGVSGVMATVAAGVACGHTGRHHDLTASTRRAVDSFWEWLAFALNSAVFLLLGAALSFAEIAHEWKLVTIGVVCVLVARAIVVACVTGTLYRTRERIAAPWAAVLAWGGLRGALSLVLALSLPMEPANYQRVVALTAGTVAVSLLVQGMTMAPLLRRLGVTGKGSLT